MRVLSPPYGWLGATKRDENKLHVTKNMPHLKKHATPTNSDIFFSAKNCLTTLFVFIMSVKED